MTDEERLFDDRVAGAFARNGLNTILLDIRDAVTEGKMEINHLKERETDARESRGIMHGKINQLVERQAGQGAILENLQRLVPTVEALDAERREKIGQRKMIANAGRVFTKTRVTLGAVLGTGGGMAWWHWDAWWPWRG